MLQLRSVQPNKKYLKKKKNSSEPTITTPVHRPSVFDSIFQHPAVASLPWRCSGTMSNFKSLCASLVVQTVESACSAEDPGSIPGSERSPGEGNGNPLQYPCLENPRDRGAWRATVHGVAKSRTRLSNFTFTFHCLSHQPMAGWHY